MNKKFIFILAAGLVLVGCSFYSIDSQDTTLDFYPPKASPDKVIYLKKVEQPHEVIGIVTVDTERNRSFDEVVAKMINEAAILGGDAITDVRRDLREGAGKTSEKLLSNAYIRIRYTAKVVVFK
jgi:uncharacterized lipoprotein YajG